MENSYNIFVIPCIHWDRAWDVPFQQNRIKLVRCIDRLIQILSDGNKYTRFSLGGQAVAIEDYIEIRPEMEKELKRLIRNGKVDVGPWYTLTDVLLVSPESIIRNLMFGFMVGELAGKAIKVGYIPDSSGLFSQLPQILQGFGIESVIFKHGLGDEGEILGDEFIWHSPDGKNSVIAIHQKIDSFDLNDLVLENQFDDVEKLEKILKDKPRMILLNADQALNDEAIDKIICLNEKLENIDIVQCGFDDYINYIKSQRTDFGEHKGELRGSRYYPIMTGVVSSRIYLKQINEMTQTLLERWAEPFSSLSWSISDNNYPKVFLHYAWKELLKNQSHNNIRGCCSDEVHREDMVRYEWANQIGEEITYISLKQISENIDLDINIGYPIVVFNPLCWARSDPVTVELPASKIPENPIIKDHNGNFVPSQITFSDSGIALLSFQAEIPSLGYATFYLSSSSEEHIKSESHIKIASRVIENRFYRIKINDNGTLDILDKLAGIEYKECNLYEDSDDNGDAFDYAHAKSSKVITNKTAKADIKLIEKGIVKATMEIKFSINLPKGIIKDGESRSSAKMSCPFIVKMTIYENTPRIDLVTTFENKVDDHRLRVVLPIEIKTDTIDVEGHFEVLKRQIEPMKPKTEWVQQPITSNYQRNFLDISNNKKGLAIINKGLSEYEARKSKNGCIVYLTLLRCIGVLSRFGIHLHSDKMIPDAQCYGRHTFFYSLIGHKGDWFSAGIHRHAYEHNVPMRAIHGIFSNENKGQKLPPSMSFMSIEPSNLVVSTLKRSELGDGLILRFYNVTDKTVDGVIQTYKNVKSVKLTNLNEEELLDQEASINDDGLIHLRVNGYEIKTLKLLF